jgi:hypothetical protein
MSDYYCLPDTTERIRVWKKVGRDEYLAVIIDLEGNELYDVLGHGPTYQAAIADVIIKYHSRQSKEEA